MTGYYSIITHPRIRFLRMLKWAFPSRKSWIYSRQFHSCCFFLIRITNRLKAIWSLAASSPYEIGLSTPLVNTPSAVSGRWNSRQVQSMISCSIKVAEVLLVPCFHRCVHCTLPAILLPAPESISGSWGAPDRRDGEKQSYGRDRWFDFFQCFIQRYGSSGLGWTEVIFIFLQFLQRDTTVKVFFWINSSHIQVSLRLSLYCWGCVLLWSVSGPGWEIFNSTRYLFYVASAIFI